MRDHPEDKSLSIKTIFSSNLPSVKFPCKQTPHQEPPLFKNTTCFLKTTFASHKRASPVLFSASPPPPPPQPKQTAHKPQTIHCSDAERPHDVVGGKRSRIGEGSNAVSLVVLTLRVLVPHVVTGVTQLFIITQATPARGRCLPTDVTRCWEKKKKKRWAISLPLPATCASVLKH